MKKKIFLLAVFVLALIPFYDVKAATCRRNVIVEYVNMDNLYKEETYITYEENNEYTYDDLINIIGKTSCN